MVPTTAQLLSVPPIFDCLPGKAGSAELPTALVRNAGKIDLVSSGGTFNQARHSEQHPERAIQKVSPTSGVVSPSISPTHNPQRFLAGECVGQSIVVAGKFSSVSPGSGFGGVWGEDAGWVGTSGVGEFGSAGEVPTVNLS